MNNPLARTSLDYLYRRISPRDSFGALLHLLFPLVDETLTYGEFRSDSAHRQANLDRAAVVIPAIRRLPVRSSRKLIATDPGLLPVQVLSGA